MIHFQTRSEPLLLPAGHGLQWMVDQTTTQDPAFERCQAEVAAVLFKKCVGNRSRPVRMHCLDMSVGGGPHGNWR